MAKHLIKTEKTHEEELGVAESFLLQKELRANREKNVARVGVLWNRRKLLGLAAGTGLVVATLAAFLIPKRYTSTVRLMPPDQTSSQGAAMLAALTGRVGGSLAGIAENALGIKTTGDLFVGILGSNTVEDDVIHKFDLQNLYRDRYIEEARTDLATHSGISIDPRTGIISLTAVDRDPRRAAAIAQEFVNELNWVVTHLSTSSAHRERVFLDERLVEVKENLETDEKQFSQFASEKSAIDIPEQGKAMVTAAAGLQGQLIATEAELESLRQIYTDNNVRIRALQARVDDLHKALEKLGGKGTDENSSADQLYPSLKELPLLGVRYADLLRRTKVEEAVFEALTQQDEMAKVEEAKEIPSVKILDPPLIPEEKSFPPRLLVVFLGTLTTLLAGIVWILTTSAWEVLDPNDPRKMIMRQIRSDIKGSVSWGSSNGASGRASLSIKEDLSDSERNRGG